MAQSIAAAPARVATGAVVSKDGTTIGYRRLGEGPGLIVLHGAMESSGSHLQLAEALAESFTVYLPDRRGRGMSGPYPARYSVSTDIEDMDALLAETGARYVFGRELGRAHLAARCAGTAGHPKGRHLRAAASDRRLDIGCAHAALR
ncbi:MAG: alpha/beta hydrolase [Chloroflexota bacterium]|nr:alpha/beta hydrolase [Chloroflexota bacterium]